MVDILLVYEGSERGEEENGEERVVRGKESFIAFWGTYLGFVYAEWNQTEAAETALQCD